MLGATRVKRWLVVAMVLLITLVIWATWAWAHMDKEPAFPCVPPPPSGSYCV